MSPFDSHSLPHDPDPTETREWLDALGAVLQHGAPERVSQLLAQLNARARRDGGVIDFNTTTDYVNTIPFDQQALSPGDPAIEKRIRDIIRWNAMAMVVRANRKPGELGGHLASFASSAVLSRSRRLYATLIAVVPLVLRLMTICGASAVPEPLSAIVGFVSVSNSPTPPETKAFGSV